MIRRKDGTLGPLFINRKQRIPIGEWLPAERHETKGYAYRPGWHCLISPYAPHLKDAMRTGRVWVKVEILNYTSEWRGEHQGGQWYLAQNMRVLEVFDNRSQAQAQHTLDEEEFKMAVGYPL